MSIEGRIAQVLTPTTAAINVGADDGVTNGSTVSVVDVVRVNDPVTGEELGTVSVPRVTAKVVQVKPRLSVIRVTSTYTYAGKNYLKSLTNDPDLADYKTVFVPAGMGVEVEVADDVPF